MKGSREKLNLIIIRRQEVSLGKSCEAHIQILVFESVRPDTSNYQIKTHPLPCASPSKRWSLCRFHLAAPVGISSRVLFEQFQLFFVLFFFSFVFLSLYWYTVSTLKFESRCTVFCFEFALSLSLLLLTVASLKAESHKKIIFLEIGSFERAYSN